MPPSITAYNEFQSRYEGESERAVAILAAAYLESFLESYLKATFVDFQTIDNLFSGYGPLATFSSKTDIAFAIGLFPEHTYRDLGLIRKVRNSFAHDLQPLSFEDSPISDYCSNLSGAVGRERSDGSIRKVDGAKAQYLDAVFWSFQHMQTEMERKPRLKIPQFRFMEVVEDDEQTEGSTATSG